MSKNASALRKEHILPPGTRNAAKAAARSIGRSVKEHKEVNSLGGAIDQVYKEWKEEAVPVHKRSPYQHMEALVYKTVRNFRTHQLPIARGRAILDDIGDPDLSLGDVVKVLHRIAASVKSYGVRSVRTVSWSSKALEEHATIRQMDTDLDSSSDSEDDDTEEEMEKPVPPHHKLIAPVHQPAVFARKSFGAKAPPPFVHVHPDEISSLSSPSKNENKSIKHESTFDTPAPKRQAVGFVAKTPAPLVSLSEMGSNENSTPLSSSSSIFANMGPNEKFKPLLLSSSSSSQPPQPALPSSSSSLPPQPALPSSSSSLPPQPAPQEPESYGWDGSCMLPHLSFTHPLEKGNDAQPVYDCNNQIMENQIAEIDTHITKAWNNAHYLKPVQDLIHKNGYILSHIDTELTEHWSQMPLCLIVYRLFQERRSRGTTFHDQHVVNDVLVSILNGSITGNDIGKIYNPDLKAMRELRLIARHTERWEVLISCMTFHLRNDKKARNQERLHLHFLRRILLAEADEWVWK